MMIFVIAALTVAATIWAVKEPKSPHNLTMDELADFVVLGCVA
jgi:hypothetical protein